jgi:hypothetical protein
MNYPNFKSFLLDQLRWKTPTQHSFYGYEHTLNMFQAAEQLIIMENVKGENAIMVKTAVLLLNAAVLEDENCSPEISARLARRWLPEFGYTTKNILLINGMLLSTRSPQRPQNLLEKIVCDASTEYLGREDYPYWAEKLYRQMFLQSKPQKESGWPQMEQTSFANHQYFTETAKRLWNANKQRNYKLLQLQAA